MPRLSLALVLCLALTVGHARAEDGARTPQNVPAATAPPETVVIEIGIPPEQPTVDETERLREMYRDAHEAMEGDDDSAPFWYRWIQNFNYRRIAMNAQRWYLLRSGDIGARDHAANLAVMFLTSHTIETVGGWALAGAGANPEVAIPWPLRIAMGVIGVGVSLPGLDPLCYLLGTAYFTWPQRMNRVLTIPRVIVVNVGGTITHYLGINAVLNWMVTRRDGAEFLRQTLERNTPGVYRWTTTATSFDFSLLNASGGVAAELRMQRHGDQALSLGTLTLATGDTSPAARAHLAKLLKPFGTNVREAVLEAFDAVQRQRLPRLGERRYVEVVDSSGTDTLVVRFRPPAIRLGPQLALRPWSWFRAAASWCASLIAG